MKNWKVASKILLALPILALVGCTTPTKRLEIGLCEKPVRESNEFRSWIKWGLEQETALENCNVEIRKARGN
jgi:hypothetical protein